MCFRGFFHLKETLFLLKICRFLAGFRTNCLIVKVLESPLDPRAPFYKIVQESPSKNKTSSSVRGYTLYPLDSSLSVAFLHAQNTFPYAYVELSHP